MNSLLRCAESNSGSGGIANISDWFEVSLPAFTCTCQQPACSLSAPVGSTTSKLVSVTAVGVTVTGSPACGSKETISGVTLKPLPFTVRLAGVGMLSTMTELIAVAEGEKATTCSHVLLTSGLASGTPAGFSTVK